MRHQPTRVGPAKQLAADPWAVALVGGGCGLTCWALLWLGLASPLLRRVQEGGQGLALVGVGGGGLLLVGLALLLGSQGPGLVETRPAGELWSVLVAVSGLYGGLLALGGGLVMLGGVGWLGGAQALRLRVAGWGTWVGYALGWAALVTWGLAGWRAGWRWWRGRSHRGPVPPRRVGGRCGDG